MKQMIYTPATAATLCLFAGAASAACTAEYKAKQDDPLRLEHGTVEIAGDCTVEAAMLELKEVLEAKGWTLLKVLSVKDS
jgi:hypothetical protein